MTSIKRLIMATAAGVLAAAFAADASALCKECGTVTSVNAVKKQGEGSGLGAVLGGVAGGVLGHQVGSGRGRDVATVAGAAGGAYAGHQIEKSQKSTTNYVVHVKLEDGTNRTFSYRSPTSFRVGDKVKIVDRKLVRQ